jgi:hypothetical protein
MLTALIAGLLSASLLGAAPTTAATAAKHPVPYNFLPYAIAGGAQSDAVGTNDWSCRPTKAHPRPVVLVHGLMGNRSTNWPTYGPLLANEGYCVFALTYGVDPRATFPPFDQMGGVVPMEQSALELAAFVDRVLGATQTTKVDIVGHSEGSLMPDHYVKFLGGAAKVDRYVGITPLWNGTNFLELGTLSDNGRPSGLSPAVTAMFEQICGSCPEFLTGSGFMEKLNSRGGPAVPGVTYTNIMTRYDELVWPYTSGMMHSPNATNFVVQDQCPQDVAEHGDMAYDPIVAQDTLNALDPTHARPVNCGGLPPFFAGQAAAR